MRTGISGGQKKRLTTGRFERDSLPRPGALSLPRFSCVLLSINDIVSIDWSQGRCWSARPRCCSWTRYPPAWIAPLPSRSSGASSRLSTWERPPCWCRCSSPRRRSSTSSTTSCCSPRGRSSTRVPGSTCSSSSRSAAFAAPRGKVPLISCRRFVASKFGVHMY